MTVRDLMLKIKGILEDHGFETDSAKFSNLEDYAECVELTHIVAEEKNDADS